jgi:hypothetical protein
VLQAWRRDEPPAWELNAQQAWQLSVRQALRPVWIHAPPAPDDLQDATPAQACWLHAIQEQAYWLYATPDVAHCEERGATRSALPVQDGFPRAFQASSPELASILASERDEIRASVPDAIPDARPEREFRDEPQEHVPRGGSQAFAFQAVPRERELQDALPDVLQVEPPDEQQEHEPRGELPAPAIPGLDEIQDAPQAHGLQVALPVELPGLATRVVPQAFAIQDALRVRGLQVELPKRCVPGQAVSPPRVCADGRRWPLRKQCDRRGLAQCAGFEQRWDLCDVGSPPHVPLPWAGAEYPQGRRCTRRGYYSRWCSAGRWFR